ncbi:CU044_5270 family protein [Aeromicrobium sp. Root344]|uniref:CU044_5270 family protein n=1 Tax=Aeromicrobium sp. Root344 TaxID=1736521 RepID=UPI000AC251AE|nr:CU044_5270 family protein [Aeromicrobium sp. Root344]
MKPQDDSLAEIRRAYADALATPEDFGMTLEPAATFSARMIANESRARTRKRRIAAVAASGVAAASVLTFGALQPWRTASAEASVPQPLSFEHGLDSNRSATEALQSLSLAAAGGENAPSGSEQHVVMARWPARPGADADATDEEPISDLYERVTRQDGSVSVHRVGSISLDQKHEDDLALASTDLPKPTGGEPAVKGAVDPDFARNLPSDPDKMRAALLAESSCPDSEPTTADTRCILEVLTAMHSNYVVPAAAAATEWAMLAKEKGTTYLGRVRERAGRDAVAISVHTGPAQGDRVVLIADPDDGRLLGIEELNQDSDSIAVQKVSIFLRSSMG